MWSSVSGLLTHGEKMNVIGNNIANVNTIGFKSQRMDFQDFFYQGGFSAGGPTQIGRGVSVNAVLGDFSDGSFEATNDPMDLAIGGNGFFQVKDPYSDQVWYTRAGNFRFDKEGYLRNPAGYTLQGWKIDNSSNPAIATGSSPAVNTVSPVQGSGVPTDIVLDTWTVPPKQTTKVQLSLNLTAAPGNDKTQSTTNPFFAMSERWNGTQPPNPPGSPPLSDDARAYSTSLKVYDEGGTSHTLTTYFDQVTGDAVQGLPRGYRVYEYMVTMNPAEDMRTFGGVYDPLTGLLTDGNPPAWVTGSTIAAGSSQAAAAKGNNFNGDTYATVLAAFQAQDATITGFPIIQYPSGGWIVDDTDPKIAAAVAADPALAAYTTLPAAPTNRLDNSVAVKNFSETSQAGVLMKGTITFNSAGEIVNQTAYTYMGNTDYGPNQIPNNSPTDMDSWQPTAVSNNGLPVFSANFSGYPLANSVRQETDNDQPDASKYLIEFDLGFKCVGNMDDPWGVGAPVPPPGNTSASIADATSADPTVAKPDYANLTNFVDGKKQSGATTNTGTGQSTTYASIQDGYSTGNLSTTSVDQNGIMYGYYSNGVSLPLYQITMYDFVDTQGLRREGGNLFSATRKSGNPQVSAANQGGMGSINAYNIEQSNVDMSREFVQMIITQRGFQANSKGITTVDTMLEQVINMKR